MKDKRCKCILPWTTLILDATGVYRPCCTIAPIPLDNMPRSKDDLLRIFNSPEMVELRRKIVSNDLSGIACDWCDAKFVYDEKITSHTFPADQYVRQQIYGSFYNDHIYLNHLPAHLSFQTSKTCNINCIMCNQKPLKKLDLKLMDINAISTLFDSISFSAIATICIWGGEPLFAIDALQIIDLLKCRDDLENTNVQIITNGVFIEKHLDIFDVLKNWTVSISLDAIGDLFNYIRHGADFNSVDRGIKALVLRSNGTTKRVSFNSIIMKSTLGKVEQLINYVQSLGLSPDIISFQLIHGNNEENFFNNPSSLANIDWEAGLQKSIEFLKSMNYENAAQHLSLVMQQMIRGLKKADSDSFASQNAHVIIQMIQDFSNLIDGTNLLLAQGLLAKDVSIVESWKDYFKLLVDASPKILNIELWDTALNSADMIGISDHLVEVFSSRHLTDDVKSILCKFYNAR